MHLCCSTGLGSMPSSLLPRPLQVIQCCKKLLPSLWRWDFPPWAQSGPGNAAPGVHKNSLRTPGPATRRGLLLCGQLALVSGHQFCGGKGRRGLEIYCFGLWVVGFLESDIYPWANPGQESKLVITALIPVSNAQHLIFSPFPKHEKPPTHPLSIFIPTENHIQNEGL